LGVVKSNVDDVNVLDPVRISNLPFFTHARLSWGSGDVLSLDSGRITGNPFITRRQEAKSEFPKVGGPAAILLSGKSDRLRDCNIRRRIASNLFSAAALPLIAKILSNEYWRLEVLQDETLGNVNRFNARRILANQLHLSLGS
jgi:hypothetical protein